MEKHGFWSTSQDARGVPGATSNTAPLDPVAIVDGQLVSEAPGAAEAANMSTLSSKTTRNYEMDRAVRHVKRQGGILDRISVAVVINQPVNTSTIGDEGQELDGTAVAEGFSELEIERFTDLVKGLL